MSTIRYIYYYDTISLKCVTCFVPLDYVDLYIIQFWKNCSTHFFKYIGEFISSDYWIAVDVTFDKIVHTFPRVQTKWKLYKTYNWCNSKRPKNKIEMHQTKKKKKHWFNDEL